MWLSNIIVDKFIAPFPSHGGPSQEMDEKMTWIPTCSKQDNVWWSPKFFGGRIQVGFLNSK